MFELQTDLFIFGIRERWTLTWIKGDRFATAEKIISYKAVISVPEIRLKKNEITVGPRTKKIRLYAWCKAETKHVWRSAEGNSPEIDLYKSDSVAFVNTCIIGHLIR